MYRLQFIIELTPHPQFSLQKSHGEAGSEQTATPKGANKFEGKKTIQSKKLNTSLKLIFWAMYQIYQILLSLVSHDLG
jgi:hypothetical protein